MFYFIDYSHHKHFQRKIQAVAEENQKAREGSDYGELHGKRAENKVQKQYSRVHIGKVFYLYGYKEEYHNLHLRIEVGEGEKHREIHIKTLISSAEDERGQYRTQHGENIEGVEFKCSPGALQTCAYPIIEIKGEGYPDDAWSGGNKDKGYKPPDLPLEDHRPIQIKEGFDVGSEAVGHDVDDAGYQGNVQHQVFYAPVGVLVMKPLDKFHI